MQHLVQDLLRTVQAKCWYAATSLALALPDICSAVDAPESPTGVRYRDWAKRYFEPLVSAADRAFFTADELYKLRCRFLHEGEFSLFEPPAADTFGRASRICLYACPVSIVPARGFDGGAASYGIAVDEFCETIASAAQAWFDEASTDAARAQRLGRLPRVIQLDQNGLERQQ